MRWSRDTTSRFYDEVATCRERCISARRLPPNKPFPLGERCAGHFDPARSTPTDHRMPIPLQEAKLRLTGPAMRAARTVDLDARPSFGVRVAAPLKTGHRDRTEVDMRFGDLLVEAKLTESDFQSCPVPLVERYRDFEEVFDTGKLPRSTEGYVSYQLLRNVLAAHAANARFCVLADARRPDLREQWFAVMRCIQNYELRLRGQMLTWQEIAMDLPVDLRRWLGAKYGIFAPGTEPQLDASEWYW